MITIHCNANLHFEMTFSLPSPLLNFPSIIMGIIAAMLVQKATNLLLASLASTIEIARMTKQDYCFVPLIGDQAIASHAVCML